MLPRSSRYIRYGGRLYVAQDPFEDAAERVKEDTPEQKARRHIQTLVDGVTKHSVDLLDTAKIKPSGDSEVAPSGDNENPTGISIKYPAADNSFKGLPATLYFDYLVAGAEGDEGPTTFWESVQNVLTQPQERYLEVVGKGNFRLRQLVLNLCGANYGSKEGAIPSINKLLEAIGFIQSRAKRHPTRQEGKKLERGATEEQQRDWYTMVLRDVKRATEDLTARQTRDVEVRKKNLADLDAMWDDKEFVKKSLKYINRKSKTPLKTKDINAIIQFIDDESDIGAIMRSAPKTTEQGMKGPGTIRETLQRRIANIVNKQPYSINYTAWDRMEILSGADENEIVAMLEAPMYPVFVFTRVGGGTTKLKTASIKLCKQAFVVKTEQDAAKLAWSAVVMGFARKLGTNPEAKRHVPADNFFDISTKKATEKALEEGKKVPEGGEAGGPTEDILKEIRRTT